MAKLTVRLHGQEFAQLTLEDGQEYVIGRSSDCAIVLQEQRGISRQHLKLFQRDDSWFAESLSRFVPLKKDGEAQETIELDDDCVFYAPPYEFHFEVTRNAAVATSETDAPAPSPAEMMVPRVDEPAPMSNVSPEAEAAMTEDTLVRGNMEATVAGQVTLVPYLRVHYNETDQQEVLRLEGQLWVAGRESASEIPLRDTRASRRHFELSRMSEGFFIIDLGSANGTKLNGQRLPPHEPTRIGSGDIISVLDIEMTLEIHDTALSNRLQQLPAAHVPMYMPQTSPVPWQPSYPTISNERMAPALPAKFEDWKNWRNWKGNLKRIDYKKHKLRIALLALAPVLLYGALSGSGNPPETGRKVAGKAEPMAFDKLTNEQKNAVKDTFSLARNLYVQGKYELCLAELAKLHEMIPMYENSKELEAFCNQGRELVLRQKDIDRREKEKAMLEQQISSVVDGCKEKLKDGGNVDQVRECLAPAMELNPEHPSIAEMIGAAQAREEERKLLDKQRAARRAKMMKGEEVYQKAKALYKKGQLAKSIHIYERFIQTPYPDLNKTKESAQREVASIRGELNRKVSGYLDQCKALGEKGQFKDAYLACDQALKEDPANEIVKTQQDRMLATLRSNLKSIYEDSVLEESLGNVDSAKEKWKKIIKEDLDFDDYSKKARTLLKKYGVEM